MISPMIFYLVITGFIGAFKAYSDAVALFGTDLNAAGMNTIVGYVYDMLYGDSGGYPVLCFRGGNPSVCDRSDDHLHQPSRQQKTCALLKGRPLWTKELDYGQTEERATGKKPEPAQDRNLYFSDVLGASWCCFHFTGCF